MKHGLSIDMAVLEIYIYKKIRLALSSEIHLASQVLGLKECAIKSDILVHLYVTFQSESIKC